MQLPGAFLEYIKQYPVLECLSETLLQSPVTSLRINPFKWKVGTTVMSSNISDRVPWCNNGVYLRDRPQFTFDPCLHQGLYYVQDASSMAISAVIDQITGDSPVAYLDACAAPGGKTTCAISALPSGSVVVANEYDHRRSSILYENIAKWGAKDIVVSRGDTSRFTQLGQIFDIISVDAPCSGEGMMRKDIQAVEQWSPRLVESCVRLQREIISNVISCLNPGGHLIYSTCTFNRKENEENVDWMIKEFNLSPVNIELLSSTEGIETGIDCDFPCYRFIPGKVDGEGLFLAVLKKPETYDLDGSMDLRKIKVDRTGCKEAESWIRPDMDLWKVDNEIWAATSINADMIRSIASRLDTIAQGTHLATIKGKDIIPTHELALSEILNQESFVTEEITLDQAISFLHRDNINLSTDTPRGFVLLTYGSIPLGFVKNIGNRSNNLLPKQWRILSRK